MNPWIQGKNNEVFFRIAPDKSLTTLRYTIREQILDDGMVSELGISHTYRQDTGMYICQASNAFGQDEMSMHLIVQEVPEQPKNLRINAQQSRSLQLTWSQPFAGNSPIEEYHVQYKVITGNVTKCYSIRCC